MTIIATNLITASSIKMIDPFSVGYYYFDPPHITTVQRNLMVGAWNIGEEGRIWYNTTTKQWEMWSGHAVVIVG
jgi:hypothetical protein